ncbi:hypothetical protein WR25_16911 [Diploscapter pachys]|uniref:NAD-dependent epimerase/dehydratase domain-containing protein n=1 Tax=Diploscapter pachys TaxID=2018661 RepID=A0A2A2LK69_9BILA|nr:hypothetical protein WR25_16911 [Diploscapter pachys]
MSSTFLKKESAAALLINYFKEEHESSDWISTIEELNSCDLSSADSIANAVKQIRTMINDGFDALFNIAGGYNHNLSFTSDGTALPTFINAIAPYLLSTSLVDCLEKRRGNIIYTSSSSANHIRSLQASNIKFNRPVQGIISLVKSYGAYAQSKELVNLIAEEQGQRLSVRNVKIYANDPGIVNTQLADSFSNVLFNPFGFEKSDFPICKWYSDLTRSAGAKTPEQAAQSFILLGTTDKYQHLSGGKVVDYEKFVPRSRIKSENERAEIYAEMQSTYRLE